MIQNASGPKSGIQHSDTVREPAKKLNILIPTKCRESTIQEIYSYLALLKGDINVDFLHIVPFTTEEFCDCVNTSDVRYDRAVAEKKLYSFVKKFPKSKNIVYDYKVAEGNPKTIVEEMIEEGKYDMVALEIGEFCHISNSIFDIAEIISSVNIPVVTFGRSQVNDKIGTGTSMMEAVI
ncbi:MAG: hypothetical protein ACP5UZ_00765 [Thermoplasmata archaeon]